MAQHYRIYLDESGTHGHSEGDWFLVGLLFVPHHGPLHRDLCQVKDQRGYLNRNPRRRAKYRETHLSSFKNAADLTVAKDWIDLFFDHSCFFRCLAFDWGIWDPGYFGNLFEPAALKERRAYKKWVELLLQPEFSSPLRGHQPVRDAVLYLDRLRVTYGYDILEELRERFTSRYEGRHPFIRDFQLARSWRDANQCLQLCDLLLGCIYQKLVPSRNRHKLGARDHLEARLGETGVTSLEAGFWRGFHPSTMRQRLPKLSVWFWQPEKRRR
jgi:hypothetical protein